MTIYTIGHSTLSFENFYALLEKNSIGLVADIRRFPGSRRHPHFSGEVLRDLLKSKDVKYRHFEALGGRRHKTTEHSSNRAWSVSSFQYYADYMETPPFRQAVERLLEAGAESRTAVMCAEAVYFRCHRRLLSDYLLVLGHKVLHIESGGKTREHTLTKFGKVIEGRLSYPLEPDLFERTG